MTFFAVNCLSGQMGADVSQWRMVLLLRTISWYDLPKWPLSSWLWFLAALIGMTVLIWVIVRLVARVNEDTDPAEADREMLLALSDLHQEGDLSAEEYRSIRSQLAGRLRVHDERFSDTQNAAKSAGKKSRLNDVLSGLAAGEAKIRIPRSGASDFGTEELQSGDSTNSDLMRRADQETFDDEPNDPNQSGSE